VETAFTRDSNGIGIVFVIAEIPITHRSDMMPECRDGSILERFSAITQLRIRKERAMNKTKLLPSLIALIAFPLSASAIPIQYDITFGPNSVDTDGGTGEFMWDATTHLISNFSFNFGGGLAGGVNDAVADFTQPVLGGTFAEFFFEVLTGTDVHPVACNTGAFQCTTHLSPGVGLFGALDFLQFVDTGRLYLFPVAGGDLAIGEFSTRVATVPEPGAMGLFVLGILCLGVFRRRIAT
jgi:hypothetical protein